MSEGEFKRQIKAKAEFCLGDTHTPQEMKKFSNEELTIDELIINLEDIFAILEDAKQEFYTVWNNAYGSSAQQGIDIYNKWFLKYFGEKK